MIKGVQRFETSDEAVVKELMIGSLKQHIPFLPYERDGESFILGFRCSKKKFGAFLKGFGLKLQEPPEEKAICEPLPSERNNESEPDSLPMSIGYPLEE